jgi:hypothetical protein
MGVARTRWNDLNSRALGDNINKFYMDRIDLIRELEIEKKV